MSGSASFRTDATHNCANESVAPPRSSLVPAISIGLMVLVLTVGCAGRQLTVSDTQPAASARQRVIDQIVASTVKVTVEQGARRLASASGIVIVSRPANDATEAVSYVLTAAHVLAGADGTAIAVGFCGPHAARGRFPATVIHRGTPEALDLALLRITGIAVPPVRLPEDDLVRLGQPILVVGFPEGERLGLSGGIVSQLPLSTRENGIPADRPEHRVVIDAAAPRGVSGGGVFEVETGRLVGIVQGHQTVAIAMKDQMQTYTLKFPVPGATFVVPMTQIRTFLASVNATNELQALLSAAAQRLPGRPQ